LPEARPARGPDPVTFALLTNRLWDATEHTEPTEDPT